MKFVYQLSLMCLLSVTGLAQSEVLIAAKCPNFSGQYILENNDVHDITYHTEILQKSCDELEITQSDGLNLFTIKGDWRMDGQLHLVDSYSSLQATWLDGTAERVYRFSDPVHNENSTESISYQLLPGGDLKRTLDLVNPDLTQNHFETLYKRQSLESSLKP